MHVYANLICLHTRIVLSFDLNENINQDEGGADVDAGSDDEEAFLGKVKYYCIRLLMNDFQPKQYNSHTQIKKKN